MYFIGLVTAICTSVLLFITSLVWSAITLVQTLPNNSMEGSSSSKTVSVSSVDPTDIDNGSMWSTQLSHSNITLWTQIYREFFKPNMPVEIMHQGGSLWEVWFPLLSQIEWTCKTEWMGLFITWTFFCRPGSGVEMFIHSELTAKDLSQIYSYRISKMRATNKQLFYINRFF